MKEDANDAVASLTLRKAAGRPTSEVWTSAKMY